MRQAMLGASLFSGFNVLGLTEPIFKLEMNDRVIPSGSLPTVHQLAIHTVGGVITSTEVLMQIVPRGSALTVEARIAPQGVDKLSVGQAATLRLTASNRNATPELSGSVLRVSADLETDEQTGVSFCSATLSMLHQELSRLPGLALSPGMSVETVVRTGDKTAASYFAKPIQDHLQHVFRQE